MMPKVEAAARRFTKKPHAARREHSFGMAEECQVRLA